MKGFGGVIGVDYDCSECAHCSAGREIYFIDYYEGYTYPIALKLWGCTCYYYELQLMSSFFKITNVEYAWCYYI